MLWICKILIEHIPANEMEMTTTKHKYHCLLLLLAVFMFSAIPAHAAAPFDDGLWTTENGNLTIAIADNHMTLFEGTEFEGRGKITQAADGWHAKISGQQKQYQANLTPLGNLLLRGPDDLRYLFRLVAKRNRALEGQLNGGWRMAGDSDTIVAIVDGTMFWSNAQLNRMSRMQFAIFDHYWLNILEENTTDPNPIALFNYTFKGQALTFEQKGTTLFKLERKSLPDDQENVPSDNATSGGENGKLEKVIKGFREREEKILDELDQKNTKARRGLLAWLRHDHATALFKRYNTSTDEADLDGALSYSESATQLSPQTARFWKTFGLINLTAKMGMISDIQAEGAFKRVLELDAKDTEARLMLIGLLLKDKEYEKAAGHYAVLFEQKPETVIANDLHRMNLTFISADIAGWGIEIYDTYLKKHPDDGKILVAKSILLKADGYDAQASRLLDETISSAKTAEAIKATARNLLAYWRDEQ